MSVVAVKLLNKFVPDDNLLLQPLPYCEWIHTKTAFEQFKVVVAHYKVENFMDPTNEEKKKLFQQAESQLKMLEKQKDDK